MDLQATCAGYLYALCSAHSFIQSGIYKNILVIAADKLSSITNYEDRSTCILFGDGACASVVSHLNRPGLIIKTLDLGSNGQYRDSGYVPAGGSKRPASVDSIKNKQHFIHMNGKSIFKVAVRTMEESCKKCLEKEKITLDEIDWLVPHQANLRIIETLAKRLNLPISRVMLTIEKYGNTSASSVGIALDHLLQKNNVKNNQNLLLTSVGFGLAWGSAILTYSN